MKKHGIVKKTLLLSGIGIMGVLPFQANASGYKLEFQSPSVLASSGEAAVVSDASTNWFNPAGDVDLPPQYVVSGTQLWSKTKFSGDTIAAPGVPVATPGTATSAPHPLLPAIHFTMPFSHKFAMGVSMVPAWGLSQQYGNNDSNLRYTLTRIYTKTIDISPSAAFRINDKWSVAIGPDWHYFQVLNSNNVYTTPLGTTGDSISRYSISNWNTSWHAGVLFKPYVGTRIGLTYRAKIVSHLKGHSDFAVPGGAAAGLYETNLFRVNIPLPPTTTLSVYQDINSRWAVMGTVAYDQWSVIKAYYAQNFIQPTQPNLINVALPQGFHNTFDFSVGSTFRLCPQWLLRGSFKYEATPTNGAHRDVSFPDAPKYGINLGARYTLNKKFAFDAVYGHVFTPQVGINTQNPVSGAAASGNVRTHIDVLGAQLVWTLM